MIYCLTKCGLAFLLKLSIAINGTPIGGSPFPVFFSPPETGATVASAGVVADQGLGQAEVGNAASAGQLAGGNLAVRHIVDHKIFCTTCIAVGSVPKLPAALK